MVRMKFCNQDISKTISDIRFKLGQLKEYNEQDYQVKIKTKCLSYCPLQIRTLNTCNKDISITITASSIQFYQLIEDDE